jgi:hypothetical protein
MAKNHSKLTDEKNKKRTEDMLTVLREVEVDEKNETAQQAKQKFAEFINKKTSE